ncbi:MAG: hypothetical protein FWC67_04180 [Defluviitaleaceae bacterium]|nr:hypothetical protein [Defluviitaleaceae bacterium]
MEKYITILSEKTKGTLTSDLLAAHIEHLRNLQEKVFCFCAALLRMIMEGCKY